MNTLSTCKLLLTGLAVLAWPSLLFAQLPSEKLGLQQAIDYAFAHNPGWAAAQAAVRQTESRIDEAGGWAPPMVKFQQAISPVQTKNGPQDQVLSFSQKIPFPGQNDLKVRQATYRYQVALSQLELKRRGLIEEIKGSYFDLWLFEKLPDLLGQSQKVIERLADTRSIESQQNQNLLSSIFDTQAAIGENAFELAQILDQLSDARARFDRLLGRTGGPVIRSVEPPEMISFSGDPEVLIARTLKNHPKLLELKAAEQAAEAASRLAGDRASQPDLQWGFNYIKIGAGTAGQKDSGKDAYNLSLAMSLPWGNQTRGAKEKGAAAGLQVAASNRQAFEQEIREKVTAHYNHVVNAERLVDLLEQTVLPPARQADQINQRLYSGGRSQMSVSLRSKAQLINLEIKALKAKAGYLKSRAALEAWVGM